MQNRSRTSEIFTIVFFILLFYITLTQILFISWLNSFIGLFADYDNIKTGYTSNNNLYVLSNSSPIALFFLDKNKTYNAHFVKEYNLKNINSQLCIVSNKLTYLKTKNACKPISNNKVSILDSLFCQFPWLSLNMVKSCRVLDFKTSECKNTNCVLYLDSNSLILKRN